MNTLLFKLMASPNPNQVTCRLSSSCWCAHSRTMLLQMGKTEISVLVLIASFMMLMPESASQRVLPKLPALRPLCISQFALVNHACAMIPYVPISPPPPAPAPAPAPSSPEPAPAPSPDDSHGHRHGHHHGHGHGHGQHSHGHGHGHGHKHGLSGVHSSSAQEQCCHWLHALDSQCVCDLLLRMPVFLSKPQHTYTVSVDEDCTVSYECPGRLMLPTLT